MQIPWPWRMGSGWEKNGKRLRISPEPHSLPDGDGDRQQRGLGAESLSPGHLCFHHRGSSRAGMHLPPPTCTCFPACWRIRNYKEPVSS